MKNKIKILLLVTIIIVLGILIFIKFSDNDKAVKTETKKITNEIKKEKDVMKNNLVSYNGWLKIENNTLVNERKEKIRLKGISTHGLQWYSKYANYDMMKSLKEELGINLFRIAMYTEENGYIYNKSLNRISIYYFDIK